MIKKKTLKQKKTTTIVTSLSIFLHTLVLVSSLSPFFIVIIAFRNALKTNITQGFDVGPGCHILRLIVDIHKDLIGIPAATYLG